MGLFRKILNVRQKRLFYKLLFSFMIFLIVPIFLLSAISYFSIINYTKEKIKGANQVKLQLLQNNVERYYDVAKHLAMTLISDKRLDQIYGISEQNVYTSYSNVNKIKELIQLITGLQGMNTDIHSIYIYNANDDFIVTSKVGTGRENFFDAEWIDHYKRTGLNDIAFIKRKMPEDSELGNNNKDNPVPAQRSYDVITFVFPMNYTRLKGIIAVNISYDKIFQALLTEELPGEQYYVLDAYSNIIFDGGNAERNILYDNWASIEKVVQSEKESGFFTLDSQDGEKMVMFSKSGLCNLTIINITHGGLLFDRILFFKMLIIVLSVSIIIIGFVISYLLSKRIYSPVKKVLEGLKTSVTTDSNDRKNELTIIHDAVNELIKKEKETDKLIDMNRKKLMESYILRLITGQISDADVDPDFLDEYCACFVISIDRYKAFSSKYTLEEQYYYKSLILKVCDEVINMHAKGMGMLIETKEIVYIASLNKEYQQDFRKIAKTICEKIFDEISVIKDLSVSIGVGKLYNSRKDIRNSYLEAKKALQYRLLFGNKCVVYYEDIKDRDVAYVFPVEKESHIINFLKSDLYDELRMTLNELINDLYNSINKKISYESVIKTIIQLISRTIDYMVSKNIDMNGISTDSSNIYFELMELETIDDIREWLLSFFDGVIKCKKEFSQHIENEKYINEVIEIINKNYRWADLSIEWIADQLNLSYSHLRRIFKNSLGVNFIDYLNKARIDYAKELLVNTDLNIKEIALKSGYNNDQCLTRFFKRYEGVTPGKYRESETRSRPGTIEIKHFV